MQYKVKINGSIIIFQEKIVKGSDILEKAEFVPIEEYDLLKEIQGREFEPIQNDEKVDLSEPGIEKFKVLKREKLVFYVDDEKYFTNEIELTPIEILEILGLSQEEYYLKEIKNHLEINYKNDEYKSIIMLHKPKFITCVNEPTVVS